MASGGRVDFDDAPSGFSTWAANPKGLKRAQKLKPRLLAVEVLQLGEVLPLGDEALERGRVLTHTVPAARRIADAVLWVGHPCLRLTGDVEHLEDPHEPMLRGVHLFEELRI